MEIASLIGPGAVLEDHRTGEVLPRDALLAHARGRARVLAAAGATPGDRIVLAQDRALTVLIDLLACWSLGCTGVLINPGIVAEEAARIRAAIEPRLWCNAAGDGRLDSGTTDAASGAALILMTSGTTGRPKGIVLGHGALAARIAENRRRIGDDVLARTLSVLPIFFGHGLIGTVLTPLASGARVILWPRPGMDELTGLGAALDRHGATFTSAVPSFWRMALRLSPPPSRALARVHVGSEPLPLALWQQIADWAGTRAVFNMYGLTETANWVAGAALGATDAGYVGHPWGGEFAILDAQGDLASRGTGEVLIRDPAIMSGLWRDAEATAAAFLDGWFRTGDIGRLDASGALTLLGRAKTQINRGGVKILAEEIEMMLERHPDVSEAAAFALPDPVSGEAVGAAVVLAPAARADADVLRRWCTGQVRAEAVPARIAILPALVRNDRGKVMRDATRAEAFGA